MMNLLAATCLGLAVGFCSALVPVFNAEAYAVASVAVSPWLVVPIIVALALGQTAGKLLLFEAARRGSTRFRRVRKGPGHRSVRWAHRIQQSLREPRTAIPLVLTSAGLGLPPLAVVSVAAGAAGQRRSGFALMCFAGRTVRFTALAVPVALALART